MKDIKQMREIRGVDNHKKDRKNKIYRKKQKI